MKVKSIRIVFEPTNLDDPLQAKHATQVDFENGMWNANGPVFSRIGEGLHAVWKLLRNAANGGTYSAPNHEKKPRPQPIGEGEN